MNFKRNIFCLTRALTFEMAIKCVFPIVGFSICSGLANAALLLPPPYETQNRHNVDLIGGGVSILQQDIVIGGGMGLAHSVGSYTSNFANFNDENYARFAPEGYREQYRGIIDEEENLGPPYRHRYSVSDGGGTVEFYISTDHKTFTPVSDSRYKLEYVSNPTDNIKYHQSIIDFNNTLSDGFKGFVFSKPDGTLVYFPAATTDSPRAFMSHIQKPNGILIEINKKNIGSMGAITSVSTNTGFQLKYIYQYNSKADDGTGTTAPIQARYWSELMPKYLLGINNAIVSCPSVDNLRPNDSLISNEGQSKSAVISASCSSLTDTTKWPVVTYAWPDAMPRSMYTSAASFTVTNPQGVTTEYIHSAISTKGPGDEFKYENSAYDTTPRLTQIKKNGKVLINYSYRTNYSGLDNSIGFASAYINPGKAARLVTSWKGADEMSYGIGAPYGSGNTQTGTENTSAGYQPVSAYFGQLGLSKVEAWDKSIRMDGYASGRLSAIDNKFGNGLTTTFEYDESIPQEPTNSQEGATAKSHNITKKKEGNVLITEAWGYAKCTLVNYKICNQPAHIKDPNGYTTDYEYDPLSGQPSKVTLPANQSGIQAQTRYYYTPLYAYYKKPNETSITKAYLPVYLLTQERKCQTTAAKNDGCTGSDEVVIDYDYGPKDGTANNLFLRSMKVTAKNSLGNMEVRRICYSYDDFGNRIGETKPKANLAACY